MISEAELSDFWSDIKSKILEMRVLDPQLDLLPGAKRHQYAINPILSEKVILQFEKKYGIELPAAYRTYLLKFGENGASADGGILRFSQVIKHGDFHKSCSLQPFEGIYYLTEDEDPIDITSGLALITPGANPNSTYIILRGKWSGSMVWDTRDSYSCGSDFANWYNNWANVSLEIINKRIILRQLPVGSSIDELRSLMHDEEIQFGSDKGRQLAYIRHKADLGVLSFIELDKNNRTVAFYGSMDEIPNQSN